MTKSGTLRTRRTVQVSLTILAALALIGGIVAPSGAYVKPGRTVMVSLTVDGKPATDGVGGALGGITGWGHSADISRDGRYVTFDSSGLFLTRVDATPPGPHRDIYVRDLRAGQTKLVSVSSEGIQGIGTCPETLTAGSRFPAISGNGRYIAFMSCATNLVPGDTNDDSDVFVHDRTTGETVRVSVSSAGDQGDGGSYNPSIDDSGRYVVFGSYATNLASGPEGNVFIHDMKMHKTRSVGGYGPSTIDPTGRFVGIWRLDATSTSYLLFVKNLKTNKLSQVTRSDPPFLPYTTWTGNNHVLSSNGRYVVFLSRVQSYVPRDSRPDYDVFVHDTKTGRYERISVNSYGEEPQYSPAYEEIEITGQFDMGWPQISADGRFIVFGSTARNFFPNDTEEDGNTQIAPPSGGGDRDIFVHDLRTGSTTMMSVNVRRRDGSCEGRGAVNGGSIDDPGSALHPAISANGRHIAFMSCNRNLVANDPGDPTLIGNGDAWQLYVRDQGIPRGVGGWGTIPPPDDETCVGDLCIPPVCVSGVCIPPDDQISERDAAGDVGSELTRSGANLYGVGLAYRPRHEDLFATIELQHMPQVTPGVSPIVYGLRFAIANKRYEVRASSSSGGTFGLFDCTASASSCTKVSDLRGGYGTTGERVVISIPLADIGLRKGGRLSKVVGFSALGTFETGAIEALDVARLR